MRSWASSTAGLNILAVGGRKHRDALNPFASEDASVISLLGGVESSSPVAAGAVRPAAVRPEARGLGVGADAALALGNSHVLEDAVVVALVVEIHMARDAVTAVQLDRFRGRETVADTALSVAIGYLKVRCMLAVTTVAIREGEDIELSGGERGEGRESGENRGEEHVGD